MADMFDDTCGACVHFQPVEKTEQGNCMRYPPTPVPIMRPQAPAVLSAAGQRESDTGFGVVSIRAPVMVSTPGCGEYETPDQGAIGYTEPSTE